MDIHFEIICKNLSILFLIAAKNEYLNITILWYLHLLVDLKVNNPQANAGERNLDLVSLFEGKSFISNIQ